MAETRKQPSHFPSSIAKRTLARASETRVNCPFKHSRWRFAIFGWFPILSSFPEKQRDRKSALLRALWTPLPLTLFSLALGVDRWKCPLCRGGELTPANYPDIRVKRTPPLFPLSLPMQPPLPKLRPKRVQATVVPKQTGTRCARLNDTVFDSISCNDNTHYFLAGRIFVEDCEARSSIADWLRLRNEFESNVCLDETDISLRIELCFDIWLWGNFIF